MMHPKIAALGEVGPRFLALLPEKTLLACIERLARLTADLEPALIHGERWIESSREEQGRSPDIDDALDWLLPTWASGDFLPRLLVRRPWLFDRFQASQFKKQAKPRAQVLDEILHRTSVVTSTTELNSALRGFKIEEIFSIGARDLAGWMEVMDVTAELSAMADGTAEAACRFHRRALVADYGEPLNEAGAPTGFVIIGMGKLGGNELNFSSDIDLIYLYENEGETSGARLPALSNGEFFHKLATRVSSSLNDVTDEGFVFRVDLRLRPEGNQGPLVNTVGAAANYYMTWGQTWERAALLKARPIAGDLALGENFLAELVPFSYRRHLDYSTVEDIKLMKQKIDVNLSRARSDSWDGKLGNGGIREIEFIAQTLLLVHAGKQKALRTRSTLEAFRRLEALNLMTAEEVQTLTGAYVFHRRLEHRLQIEHERQTQRLDNQFPAHVRMARLMGFSHENQDEAVAAFEEELTRHRNAVQLVYRRLFEAAGEEILQGIHPAILAVTDVEGNDEERLKTLAGLGFEDAERALATMRRLVETPQARHVDPKGRRYLERIMPLLLSQSIAAPDPDLALLHLEDFMHRVGGWQSYHSLLAENPGTLKLLVRFFGTSSFLSRFFIKHPELLDQLVLATYVTPMKEYAQMDGELRQLMSEAEDEESALDTLRHFKNTEMLRIAINDIDGQLDIINVTTQLANLADAVLHSATTMALRLVEQRYGKAETAELVTLGMGKFGGGEMNYSSDLDLIFVYTGEGMTVGERSVSLPEFFGKLVQRIISTLTLSTREGQAYPIDARLRPSGNAGPLVTSLESFENYHRSKAAVWERQALIKARPIVGSAGTAKRIQQILDQAIYERPLSDSDVAEILRVRKRMELEIDPETNDRFNIKTGMGGIVDIEFFVQLSQLQNGGEYHSLRTPNTFLALGELMELHLIDSSDYQILREGYLFLRRVENRMRILQDSAKSMLPKNPLLAEKLALSMNYPRGQVRGEAGQALLADFTATRENVRKVYARRFEK